MAKSQILVLRRDLRTVATPERATVNRRFFKTGPGEYGEGDRFLGVTLPDLRRLSRTHRELPLGHVERLLKSPWHEERLVALLILIEQYRRGDIGARNAIYRLYLRHTKYINNWDLVDCSAEHIVGRHLDGRDRARLRRLARSRSLWERRIAMLSTFHYIKQRQFDDALAVAEILLEPPRGRGREHDLIHKAVGWMLREIGKRDRPAEERFLRAHAHRMPRTALRYAIEKFPEPLRRRYLAM